MVGDHLRCEYLTVGHEWSSSCATLIYDFLEFKHAVNSQKRFEIIPHCALAVTNELGSVGGNG